MKKNGIYLNKFEIIVCLSKLKFCELLYRLYIQHLIKVDLQHLPLLFRMAHFVSEFFTLFELFILRITFFLFIIFIFFGFSFI